MQPGQEAVENWRPDLDKNTWSEKKPEISAQNAQFRIAAIGGVNLTPPYNSLTLTAHQRRDGSLCEFSGKFDTIHKSHGAQGWDSSG